MIKCFNQKKIIVGMSGGVDSSIAMILLKKQGWYPIGLSLKYAVWNPGSLLSTNKKKLLRENICCNTESFKIAKHVCKSIGAPHYIFDVSREFEKEVIEYFLKEFNNNRTPNPCVICNRYLKFKKLFEWAKKRNVKYVATGHYAGVVKNEQMQKYELLMAKDKEKDQTYSLCFLPQTKLKYILFPLENYTKQEVYKMAQKYGFKIFLKQKESQDFCFVANKSIDCFLKKEIGLNSGLIKDDNNKVIGKHQGLHFYTIGQRKGINLSGGPYFVVALDSKNNVLIVSKKQKDLYVKKAILSFCHFISGVIPKKPLKINVKVRSHSSFVKAVLTNFENKKMELIFNKKQKAVTPGQFAVFYNGNICLGGGKIIKTKNN